MWVATIDAGTTNTRARIWHEDKMLGEASVKVGVRNTAIDGNNQKLVEAIRNTLSVVATKSGRKVSEIKLILASGMLTSNVGLVEIPHIEAPADCAKLAAAMVSKVIPEICPQPIWFVPGIKNLDGTLLPQERMEEMDIMRGEEVEVCGLMERMEIKGPAVLVLTGSHNKFVLIDSSGQILGCMTTIAGELLYSLTNHTILADTVGRQFATKFNRKAFLLGVKYSRQLGIGRASFMTRILNQFSGYTEEEAQNYMLGIILADDLASLNNSQLFVAYDNAKVIVVGNEIMQQGFATLFEEEGRIVSIVPSGLKDGLSGYGAIAVAKKRGLL
ncbi:MAG: 2-dehydro-3-deoxygalactonokinase [Selenomonadaceae bacterium]